jgi:hypothetical protein
MSYADAITELRQLLADTQYHKKATDKRLIGKVNGENVTFYTYDKRVIESTFSAKVNNIDVDSSLDDAIQGLVTLADAPAINSAVTASYYFTWWTDAELKTFLNKGAELTSFFTTNIPEDAYLQITVGLKSAALYFSASYAMDSLINYLINRRHSEEFLVEESGNDESAFSQTIAAMKDLSKEFWTKAKWARDDFYMRQGQRNVPAFGVKLGATRRYGPSK